MWQAKGQGISGDDVIDDLPPAGDELDWLRKHLLALVSEQMSAGAHSLGGDIKVLWCAKRATHARYQFVLEPKLD